CFIADISGDYQLILRTGTQKESGHYQLAIKALGRSAKQERQQAAASRALADAEELWSQSTLPSLEKAISRCQQAATIWRETGDQWQEASTLNRIGEINEALSKHRTALAVYERALMLYKQLNDRKAEGQTSSLMAASYMSCGENGKALTAS